MPARLVMRLSLHPVLPAALAAVLALPSATTAQDAPIDPNVGVAPPSAADAVKAAAAELAGSWKGWAKLSNDWPDLACRYEAAADAEPVRLELTNDAGLLHGSVAIDVPAEAGSGCPALRKRYTVAEVAMAPGTLAFSDSGGNEWTLSVRRSGAVMQGLLAWRAGGAAEPLAEGFATRQGVKPLARLAGEVRLRKAGGGAPPASAAAVAETAAPPAAQAVAGARAPARPKKTGAGTHLKNVGIVLGANVVGLAGLYGVNKLGQGAASTTGGVTCSPRSCVVGAPNAPCLCYNEILIGASCGETKTGLAENEQGCDPTALKPCAANLSCNSGVCQAENGRCPW